MGNITFQNSTAIRLKMSRLCNIVLGVTLIFAAILPFISATTCMPGGVCGPYPANRRTIKIAGMLLSQVEEEVNGWEPYPEYEVISYKEQVVKGWNYWIMIKVGNDTHDYIEIAVYQPPKEYGVYQAPELKNVQTGLTKDYNISPIPNIPVHPTKEPKQYNS